MRDARDRLHTTREVQVVLAMYLSPRLGVGVVVEITEGPQPHYVVEWGVMRDDVCADLFVQRARGGA